MKHYTRRLTTSYVAALTIIGALGFGLFAVLFAEINSQGRYATMIAAAGRQRTLVQRAALFSLRLTQESDPLRRQEFRAIIIRASVELERIERGLIEGDAALELSGHPGQEIEILYTDPPANLDARIALFCDRLRTVVAQTTDTPLDPHSPVLAEVLGAVPGELLAALDSAVSAYEHADHHATSRRQIIETVLIVLLLLALYAEVRFIFRPLVRAILRETHKQAATRQRYDAVLRTVGEAIVTFDTDNFIVSANAEAERVWGRSATEFVGQSMSALVMPGRDLPPEDWRAMFPSARRVQSLGLRPEGGAFPLEVCLTESILDGNRKSFFTLCARDISERVEAERLLAAARDAALDAARGRSEFVASVSHELRTPMNGVLGAADLLEATGLNPEQRELLDTIRTSGDSLLAIINDILDFSKMDAGKMTLEAIELDLRHLVESTADVLAGRALQRHLELIVYIEPGTPTQLVGDPARLRQVLLNLLGNAIKFTKSGEIVLRVRCDRADDASATLRFSVQDTGLGIEPAARARLFQAFSQADDSTARRFGGTGLGLTISRQIVELMGGVIDVDSVPGQGSTFWFTANFSRAETYHDATDRENPSLEGLRGTRVLIVDDNATLRALLQERLTAWEMVADAAEDAAHTLALMRAKAEADTPYDVVLLDLNLGSIDGFTLAWAIHNQPSLVPSRLILVTSLGVESDRHACAQVGIRASVTKPLKYHALLNTLAQVMAGRDLLPPAGIAALPPDASRKPNPASAKDVRVLLAEDNAINRKLAMRQLNNLGYHTDAVENGLEALAALDAASYDVVLLDMHMPVMDGCQAAMTIRQHETQLGKRRQTLIALTASTSGDDREKCLSSGMDDFLGKPVRQDELARTLSRWAPTAVTPSLARK